MGMQREWLTNRVTPSQNTPPSEVCCCGRLIVHSSNESQPGLTGATSSPWWLVCGVTSSPWWLVGGAISSPWWLVGGATSCYDWWVDSLVYKVLLCPLPSSGLQTRVCRCYDLLVGVWVLLKCCFNCYCTLHVTYYPLWSGRGRREIPSSFFLVCEQDCYGATLTHLHVQLGSYCSIILYFQQSTPLLQKGRAC